MRTVPFACRLEPPTARVIDRSWIRACVDALEMHGKVLVKIGSLRWERAPSLELAEQILDAARDELIRRGAPAELGVEHDEPDGTTVEPGFDARDRVPHHDGQRSTFITPSRDDVPWFGVEMRRYGSAPAGRHKPFAGIFIDDPGEGLSITTFYDVMAIIRDAYSVATGGPPTPWPRSPTGSVAISSRRASAGPTTAVST